MVLTWARTKDCTSDMNSVDSLDYDAVAVMESMMGTVMEICRA